MAAGGYAGGWSVASVSGVLPGFLRGRDSRSSGLLIFAIGIVLFGVAIARFGSLPKLAGIGFALGGVLFAVIGFVLSDFVQSIGAALLVASAVWIAITGWRMLRAS